MNIKRISIPQFEEVYSCTDPGSGLRAFIAVHSTRLGPACGGIRLWHYRSEEEALNDVLRLSKAMTYKAACAGLALGGGKAVIMADPNEPKLEKMLRAMGKFIDSLGGRYLAAEDARITPDDLEIIAKETRFITGLRKGSGDPSPITANGVLRGINVCIEEALGRTNLSGVTVALQGLGHVGFSLAKLLAHAGAKVTAAEINPKLTEKARKELSIHTVSPEDIFHVDADIFAPCALGGVLHQDNIPKLTFRIIAGAANNQLENQELNDRLLFDRKILYAPDFVINAGGLINIYVRDILKEKDVNTWLELIPKNLREIFSISKREKIPPGEAAIRLAEARLKS
ncbi:MAG: Glu/Leu/Phe/Val dehydrogenase [Candidatus Omnitrophica bacterium]|nr:Glu/Leu/Phe/Val dehydrogenase [Candidatus Omnitrophota bacterium]